MKNKIVDEGDSIYGKKKEKLLSILDHYTDHDVILAFSGGVDSSLLLKILSDQAARKNTAVYAITLKTMLHPGYEIAIARKVAKEMGVIHSVIALDELSQADIVNNPPDRCYRCKKCIFTRLNSIAKDLDVPVVMEGSNEEDMRMCIPGIDATKELGIVSPLIMAGFNKEEIRRMAQEYHISVAERSSSPCLATRFPYGTRLTKDKMEKVEQCEEYIKTLGIYNIRLRVHDKIARIEVDLSDFDKLLPYREEVAQYLKERGFQYITLDLEGFRAGSMDLTLPEEYNKTKNGVKDET